MYTTISELSTWRRRRNEVSTALFFLSSRLEVKYLLELRESQEKKPDDRSEKEMTRKRRAEEERLEKD